MLLLESVNWLPVDYLLFDVELRITTLLCTYLIISGFAFSVFAIPLSRSRWESNSFPGSCDFAFESFNLVILWWIVLILVEVVWGMVPLLWWIVCWRRRKLLIRLGVVVCVVVHLMISWYKLVSLDRWGLALVVMSSPRLVVSWSSPIVGSKLYLLSLIVLLLETLVWSFSECFSCFLNCKLVHALALWPCL